MLVNDNKKKSYIYMKTRKLSSKFVNQQRKRREISSITTEAKQTDNQVSALPEKEYKTSLNSYHGYNSYSYQYQNSYNNRYKQPTRFDYLRLKLSDLINPDRNKTFIDNLYAQFQSNSNQLSLLYVPPNEKLPDNAILLSDGLLKNDYSLNQLTNTNNQVESNKLLNEFYLNAIKYKSNNFYDYKMPELHTTEIFLIYFVISLWLLAVFICFRRYSLFICHHKSDVPFYDHSLVGIKLNKSLSRPTSPETNQSRSCMCNSLNDAEFILEELNNSNLISNKTTTENNLSINLDEKNQSLNNLINANTFSTIYRRDDFGSSKPSSHLICSKCNLKQSYTPCLNARINHRELTLKSYSNGNFNCIKRLDASFYKSPTTQTSCLLSNKRLNEKSNALNYSFSNKLKLQHRRCNHSWSRYYSNGLIFPNSLFNVGSNLLNKSYLASNKSSYNSVNNARAKSSSTTSTIPIVNLPSQHISELNLINENKIYDDNDYNTALNITKKRSILRNKHYNLMSLDENALYSYRKQHKMNQLEHQNKIKRKFLIAKTNLSVISANSTTITSNNLEMDESNTPLNGTILTESPTTNTFSSVTSSNNKTIKFKTRTKAALSALVSPHANFISLCSGPESSDNQKRGNTHSVSNINSNNISAMKNSELTKMGQSYDNADFLNDASSDSAKLHLNLFQRKSSTNLNNTSIPLKNMATSNITTITNPSYTYNISPKTDRDNNNQLASMRRKMFVDSRRMAQTNVDYANLSSKCEDSVYSDSNFDFFGSYPNNNENYTNSNLNSTNTNSVVINETKNTVVETNTSNDNNINEKNESDAQLLNPNWIPMIVKKALLDIHERAVLSKSESNIRNRYRSSNHLLHSPVQQKSNNNVSSANNTTPPPTITKSILKSSKKKKSLSLQNSRDKSMYISIDQKDPIPLGISNQNTNNHSSYLHNFQELRAKLFQNKPSPNNIVKQQHDCINKQESQLLGNSTEKSSAMSSFENSIISANDSSSQSNATVILNPNYFEK